MNHGGLHIISTLAQIFFCEKRAEESIPKYHSSENKAFQVRAIGRMREKNEVKGEDRNCIGELEGLKTKIDKW